MRELIGGERKAPSQTFEITEDAAIGVGMYMLTKRLYLDADLDGQEEVRLFEVVTGHKDHGLEELLRGYVETNPDRVLMMLEHLAYLKEEAVDQGWFPSAYFAKDPEGSPDFFLPRQLDGDKFYKVPIAVWRDISAGIDGAIPGEVVTTRETEHTQINE